MWLHGVVTIVSAGMLFATGPPRFTAEKLANSESAAKIA
jgi:hypothetical protein